jgi:type II secretory pathway component PulK
MSPRNQSGRLFHRSVSPRRGSALLLVLGTIILLSALVFGVVQMIDLDFGEIVSEQRDFHARLLAESGLALGMHAQISPTDSQRNRTMPGGGRFEVTIESENARININTVLSKERDQKIILKNLFDQWGLKADERDQVIDCLLDWYDADSKERLNGAEQLTYEKAGFTDRPRNGAFRSVEELHLVLHWDIVEKAKPDWRNYFTIWTDGRIDLNNAEIDTIQAAFTTTRTVAESIVKHRLGRDGIRDTEDDQFFQNPAEVQRFLGMGDDAFKRISGLMTTQVSMRRIESVGILENFRHKLFVVAANQGGQGNYTQILEWQEP